MTDKPEEQKQTSMGPVPNSTGDVNEFPSVAPHIHSQPFQYTLLVGEAGTPIEITSGARSVRELYSMLYPAPGSTGPQIERAGNVAFFPEAVVRVEDEKGNKRADIIAGWAPVDDDGDDDFEEPDPEPEPPRRKPKFLGRQGRD